MASRMRGAPRRVARRMKRAALGGDVPEFSDKRAPSTGRRAAKRRGAADAERRKLAYFAPINTFVKRAGMVAILAACVMVVFATAGACLRGDNAPVVRVIVPSVYASATPTPMPRPTPARRVEALSTAQAPATLGEASAPYTEGVAYCPPTCDADAHPQGADGMSLVDSPIIGGDIVPPNTVCQEDEVIWYVNIDESGRAARLDGAALGCLHYEYVVMDFVLDCLIGNSEHGTNNASEHARQPEYRSWCSTVIDDASDGTVSLDDLLIDTALRQRASTGGAS